MPQRRFEQAAVCLWPPDKNPGNSWTMPARLECSSLVRSRREWLHASLFDKVAAKADFYSMKPAVFLPPVIALIIGGVLVGGQRRAISKLEQESAVLRDHIATARAGGPAGTDRQPLRPDKPESADGPIDWKEMAAAFGDMKNSRGVRDMRKMLSFQSRLAKMDSEQLIAALNQIAILDLAEEDGIMLRSMLISSLATKDPQLALTRFSDQLGDDRGGVSWQLGNALGEWAKTDPFGAAAWFDQEIAAGTFDSKSLDGKNRTRLNFEANLIAQLISTDPSGAEARIEALPADQRREALGSYGLLEVKEADQAVFAKLVRRQLSEAERMDIFGNQASTIAIRGGLEKVGDYLDRIAASPQERVSSAEKAALGSIQRKMHNGRIQPSDIDSMRDWLGTEAPGSVEKITGETIGRSSMQGEAMKFSDGAALAMKYHESSGSDEVLVGFLHSAAIHENKEEARAVVEKISDSKLREELLNTLN